MIAHIWCRNINGHVVVVVIYKIRVVLILPSPVINRGFLGSAKSVQCFFFNHSGLINKTGLVKF